MYEYKALITKVYDGDTITADIDLGFDTWLKNQKLRLANIDAPEVRGESRESGLLTRDKLRERILNKFVKIKSYGKGKYGRWLVDVFLNDENINQWLLKENLAEPYKK